MTPADNPWLAIARFMKCFISLVLLFTKLHILQSSEDMLLGTIKLYIYFKSNLWLKSSKYMYFYLFVTVTAYYCIKPILMIDKIFIFQLTFSVQGETKVHLQQWDHFCN